MPVKHALDMPRGFMYLVRGLKMLLSSWGLFRFAIMPLIVNTALFVVFFFSFNTFAYYISSWVFTQTSQEWYWVILSTVLGVALFAVSILVVLLGFVVVGLIVASPFNDLLSAAVEERMTGAVHEMEASFLVKMALAVKVESRKMLIFVLIEVALLALNFIPGLGQALFVILNLGFISFSMCYEFAGYTLDRRGYDFGDKRKFIATNLGRSMGFGAAVGITLLIPIVHFLFMPVAVAGGTIMAVENTAPPGADERNKLGAG